MRRGGPPRAAMIRRAAIDGTLGCSVPPDSAGPPDAATRGENERAWMAPILDSIGFVDGKTKAWSNRR